MEIIILLLSIYGLYFLLVQSDGPWGIISYARNMLMRNKFMAVFFYKLLSCPFCSGCNAGWIIYLIYNWGKEYHLNLLICYALTGGVTCLILDALLARLHNMPPES